MFNEFEYLSVHTHTHTNTLIEECHIITIKYYILCVDEHIRLVLGIEKIITNGFCSFSFYFGKYFNIMVAVAIKALSSVT